MNQQNETIVSPEMMKQLTKANLNEFYETVPKELQEKAKSLLNGRAVADMDEEMKRKLRNKSKKMRKAGVLGY